ncbi:hypothetical protein PV797_15040 [Clostridiaceae bacterium M8S5]|nr:hypothetical protein PV797_15040 [Clostridiaceae bacterium M8S5]
MKRLNDKDSINNAIMEFKKIFKNNNPFSNVYNPKVSSKLLLFRTDGYFLTESQFSALKEAIRTLEESEMYISITEHEVGDFNNSDHWIVNTDVSYKEYIQMPIYLENAIYSKDGKWGVIISHEEHALIGGESRFIEKLKSIYFNYLKDIKEFKLYWENCAKEYSTDIGWFKSFLEDFEK